MSVCLVHLDHSASILGEDERTIADSETKIKSGEVEKLALPILHLNFVIYLPIYFLFLGWTEIKGNTQ